MSNSEKVETEELKAQLQTLRDDVATLSTLIREMGETTAGDLRETLKETADEVKRLSAEAKGKARDRARDQIDELEHHIAERPLQSALIAFLVGALFGGIMRR